MSDLAEQIRVRKPEKLDLSRVRLDLKAAFPSLAEAGLRAAFKQDKASDALIKGISSLGLNITKTPGELAWLLITRALVRAAARATLTELLPEWNGPESEWDETLAALGAELVAVQDSALQAQEYLLTSDLLDRPRDVPGLADAAAVLAKWLSDAQHVDPEQARKSAARLPELFVYAIYDEWVAQAAEYKPIDEALKVGMVPAVQREWTWSAYRAHLWSEYQKPLFGTETFGTTLRLPDLYIPLRAYYSQRNRSGTVRRGEPDEARETKHAVWLEEALNEWLSNADASPVRVIGGGPGSGKSSFLKHYAAARSAARQRPVVLVELHLADVEGDLPNLLGSYLNESGLLEHDPLDQKTGEKNLLIILDGLDELEKSGRSGQEAARALVKEVLTYTALRKLGKSDIRVLLSGREVVVSALCDELKQPEQVLHLFPYCGEVPEQDYANSEILLRDQRIDWWENFRNLTGRSDVMPPGLDEITAEPLLNYLVALAQASGKLSVDRNTNLNQVYERLVVDVWERRWGQHKHFKPSRAEFFELLEEIALVTWHGDGKGATLTTIRTRCEEAKLLPVLEAVSNGTETGVLSLLVAFFFRQRGRNAEHEHIFEFTHKSFAEYLLTRRLVYAIQEICDKRQQHSKARTRSRDGWSETEALVHWAELCGPTLLSQNSAAFLSREVQLHDREAVASWQACLVELVSSRLAAEGMPMEQTSPSGQSFPEMMRRARNAEGNLLVMLSTCAKVTGKQSDVVWPIEFPVSRWLHSFSASRPAYELVVSAGLCGLLTDGMHLDRAYLFGADLVGAQLNGAQLFDANLIEADLSKANLRGAELSWTYLIDASLQGADLRGANLSWAHLVEADMSWADLLGASLCRADLRGTHLYGANLTDADLTEAIYSLAEPSPTIWPVGFDPEKAGAVAIG